MAAANAGASPATSRSPSVVIGITETPPPATEVIESEETRESLANEPAPVIEARPSRPVRTSRPSLSPESVRALTPEPPPPVSVPEVDPFSERYEDEQDEPSSMRAIVTPDEMSIPPVGDLVVEPMAERFFSEGDLAHSLHPEEPAETWDNPDKAQRKSEPHVVERRARFSKYVTWAVGGAAVVCLAALIRTTMTHGAAPTTPKPVVAAAVAPEPAIAVEPPAPVAKAAEPAVAVEAPKVEVPPAETAAPAPAPAPTGDAKAEKNDCRKNLERGKLADAIAAGERAVALDAEDGEAWLLLGASYQEKGNASEARRAYTSCVKEGKRGPVGECRQMLR